MSGEEESNKRKADDALEDEDTREEGATVENFFEDHGFSVGSYGFGTDTPVIALMSSESLLDWDVTLGVTLAEAKKLRIFKGQNDNREAKAALRAFNDLISTIDSVRDLLYEKAKEFEEPMRVWVEKARADSIKKGTIGASEQNK